jgi:hypothetical protein
LTLSAGGDDDLHPRDLPTVLRCERGSEVMYMTTEVFPGAGSELTNDPELAIGWPAHPRIRRDCIGRDCRTRKTIF